MRALAILAFALPLLYLLGLLISLAWPVKEPALAVYRDQAPRLVASDMRKWNVREKTPDGGREGWKTYVLFPSIFEEPKVVTVTVLPDGSRLVSESVTEFWIRLVLAIVSAVAITGFVVAVWRQRPAVPTVAQERDRRNEEAYRKAHARRPGRPRR